MKEKKKAKRLGWTWEIKVQKIEDLIFVADSP